IINRFLKGSHVAWAVLASPSESPVEWVMPVLLAHRMGQECADPGTAMKFQAGKVGINSIRHRWIDDRPFLNEPAVVGYCASLENDPSPDVSSVGIAFETENGLAGVEPASFGDRTDGPPHSLGLDKILATYLRGRLPSL